MAPKVPSSSKPSQRPAKRKAESEFEVSPEGPGEEWTGFGGDGEGIEMVSDDEEETGATTDENEVEDFPEIDADSSGEDVEDEESSEDGNEEDEDDTGEEDVAGESGQAKEEPDHLYGESALIGEGLEWERKPGSYPEPKIIKSAITGEPKKVYPPIEPEYDSDSSTEDVSYRYCF